jgi:hypothetical protein
MRAPTTFTESGTSGTVPLVISVGGREPGRALPERKVTVDAEAAQLKRQKGGTGGGRVHPYPQRQRRPRLLHDLNGSTGGIRMHCKKAINDHFGRGLTWAELNAARRAAHSLAGQLDWLVKERQESRVAYAVPRAVNF